MPLFTRLRCVSSTPFGEPVVPEVYWILATSSGAVALASKSRSAGQHRVPGRFAQPDHVLQRERLAIARFLKNLPIVGARVAARARNSARMRDLRST